MIITQKHWLTVLYKQTRCDLVENEWGLPSSYFNSEHNSSKSLLHLLIMLREGERYKKINEEMLDLCISYL